MAQTHTHERRVRLPSVDGMLPESWLLSNSKYLHKNSHRHWNPPMLLQPDSCLSSSHIMNHIKSNQITTPRARDSRTAADGTVVLPHTAATLWQSRQ